MFIVVAHVCVCLCVGVFVWVCVCVCVCVGGGGEGVGVCVCVAGTRAVWLVLVFWYVAVCAISCLVIIFFAEERAGCISFILSCIHLYFFFCMCSMSFLQNTTRWSVINVLYFLDILASMIIMVDKNFSVKNF